MTSGAKAMSIKLLRVALAPFVLLWAHSSVHAASIYVDANAPDDAGNGSSSQPKKSIGSGALLMSRSGGDTLIVRAGTYAGEGNALRRVPPGTAGAWNAIKAEVDGTVTITAPLHIPLGDHYLQLEGLKWEGPFAKGITGRFVKVLRCAFKDGPSSKNTVVLGIGTNDATPGAQYILIEDSYVYGSGGRYKVLVYNADKVVLRRIVARHQGGWSDTKGDPQAVVSLYNSTDVLTQNLLLLDSGGHGYFEAALYHPSNKRASSNIQTAGAIILNIAGTAVGWDDHLASSGNRLEDSIIWRARTAIFVNGAPHSGTLDRLTIGKISGSGINDWKDGRQFSIKNSLIWEMGSKNLRSVVHQNNVCFALACSGEATMNPATSGLRWLPRIEANSALSRAGAGNTQVGATVLKRLGISGTLYGEPGYNQATTQDLWPWQNEAAIKHSMCDEVNVTTGFCAAASLTHYVWEQLGNSAPASFASPPVKP